MIEVLSVTSEIYPLIKTGGLADVAGALPAALAQNGVSMRTLVPGYPAVMAKLGTAREVYYFEDLFGVTARLFAGRAKAYASQSWTISNLFPLNDQQSQHQKSLHDVLVI
ncbi:MAG: hypothetical protein EOP20_06125 [Hyphomicrobiales bacterium]|nr:MAG: hypothetical protein EOP20_06125 [Hyphomicrobiales bacterium]